MFRILLQEGTIYLFLGGMGAQSIEHWQKRQDLMVFFWGGGGGGGPKPIFPWERRRSHDQWQVSGKEVMIKKKAHQGNWLGASAEAYTQIRWQWRVWENGSNQGRSTDRLTDSDVCSDSKRKKQRCNRERKWAFKLGSFKLVDRLLMPKVNNGPLNGLLGKCSLCLFWPHLCRVAVKHVDSFVTLPRLHQAICMKREAWFQCRRRQFICFSSLVIPTTLHMNGVAQEQSSAIMRRMLVSDWPEVLGAELICAMPSHHHGLLVHLSLDKISYKSRLINACRPIKFCQMSSLSTLQWGLDPLMIYLLVHACL